MQPITIPPSLGSAPTDILRTHILPRTRESAPQLSLVSRRFNQLALSQLCDIPITGREILEFLGRLPSRPVERRALGVFSEDRIVDNTIFNYYFPIHGIIEEKFRMSSWPMIYRHVGSSIAYEVIHLGYDLDILTIREYLFEDKFELDLRSRFDIFSRREACSRNNPAYPYQRVLKILSNRIRNTPSTLLGQMKLYYYLLTNLRILQGNIYPHPRIYNIIHLDNMEIREIRGENQRLAAEVRQLILQL